MNNKVVALITLALFSITENSFAQNHHRYKLFDLGTWVGRAARSALRSFP
jgi:hypothetical protein